MAPKIFEFSIPSNKFKIELLVPQDSTQITGNFKLTFGDKKIYEGDHLLANDLISYLRSGWDLMWYFRRSL